MLLSFGQFWSVWGGNKQGKDILKRTGRLHTTLIQYDLQAGCLLRLLNTPGHYMMNRSKIIFEKWFYKNETDLLHSDNYVRVVIKTASLQNYVVSSFGLQIFYYYCYL